MAEQLSALGVPVFGADMKGDLSGLTTPGEAARADDPAGERARHRGVTGRLPGELPVPRRHRAGHPGAGDRFVVRPILRPAPTTERSSPPSRSRSKSKSQEKDDSNPMVDYLGSREG